MLCARRVFSAFASGFCFKLWLDDIFLVHDDDDGFAAFLGSLEFFIVLLHRLSAADGFLLYFHFGRMKNDKHDRCDWIYFVIP